MTNKENIESGITYAAGFIAAHLSLDDATKIVVIIMFSLRAAYDAVRLYRYIQHKDQK